MALLILRFLGIYQTLISAGRILCRDATFLPYWSALHGCDVTAMNPMQQGISLLFSEVMWTVVPAVTLCDEMG